MSNLTILGNRRTALVLGAAGFVGRHVCRHLVEEGFSVLGLGHGQLTAEELQQHGLTVWLNADITLKTIQEVCEGKHLALIVHCAGSGAVSHSFASPANDFSRSVDTTLAMLEFARLQPTPARVVLASSAAVYGDQGDRDIPEETSVAPISPYGYHKAMAEMLCESYSRFFGLETRIVRLFSVYGEGLRKQLLWDALNKFKRGTPSFFGTGEELRDWIHVDDAARLLCLAALSGGTNHAVYNGGHVRANTLQLLTMLAKASQTSLEPVFSGEVHPGNPRRLTASHERAAALGFQPRIDLLQGLQRYATWFRTEGPL